VGTSSVVPSALPPPWPDRAVFHQADLFVESRALCRKRAEHRDEAVGVTWRHRLAGAFEARERGDAFAGTVNVVSVPTCFDERVAPREVGRPIPTPSSTA
jgi:hypothetical protein